jgi:ribosomal protein S12 methylthiotransferase accessory factor YcaO
VESDTGSERQVAGMLLQDRISPQQSYDRQREDGSVAQEPLDSENNRHIPYERVHTECNQLQTMCVICGQNLEIYND